jgi:CelD/BcsL family acetyltransferase involved in cellulose biosynthesis
VLPLDAVTGDQRAAWSRLVDAAVEPNPFFEPEPVLQAGSLLRDGRTGVAVVEDDGDLLLALPVLRRRPARHVPVRALQAWHHPYVHAGAPLVRAGRERAAWAELLDHLRHGAQEAWLLLPRLPLYGAGSVALQRELADRHLPWAADQVQGRPVVRRRPRPTYLDGRLSSRSRKTLRRQGRRLAEELGGAVLTVDLVRGGDGCDDAVETFLRLEDSGWKGRAGTALLRRPEHAEWFRRFCRHLHARGRLEVWALGVPGRAAAAQVNARAGRTSFHLRTAYDEALAAWSPGIQLELAMVEAFHADARVDLLDSCVDPDNRVSGLLYPDREVLATLAVPLRMPAGPVAVAAWAAAGRGKAALTRRRGESR